jgi:hypothetical protein
MCCRRQKDNCQKPEHLKDKPENCTPEQIRECHGEEGEKKHACESKRKCCD